MGALVREGGIDPRFIPKLGQAMWLRWLDHVYSEPAHCSYARQNRLAVNAMAPEPPCRGLCPLCKTSINAVSQSLSVPKVLRCFMLTELDSKPPVLHLICNDHGALWQTRVTQDTCEATAFRVALGTNFGYPLSLEKAPQLMLNVSSCLASKTTKRACSCAVTSHLCFRRQSPVVNS